MWKGLLPLVIRIVVAFAMIGVFVVFRIAAFQSDRRIARKTKARAAARDPAALA